MTATTSGASGVLALKSRYTRRVFAPVNGTGNMMSSMYPMTSPQDLGNLLEQRQSGHRATDEVPQVIGGRAHHPSSPGVAEDSLQRQVS